MTAVATPAPPLGIARVLGDVWGVLKRNFKTYFLLSLLLAGVPSALAATAGAAVTYPSPWGLGVGFPVVLISIIAAVVLQAALIYGVVADMNGRQVSVGECVRVGVREFLPLIGIGLVYSLAVAIGLMLLVVPGVMIAIAWSVAAPAYVIERTPWMDAFGRSLELTRGNRWRIFALGLVLLGIAIVVGLIVGLPAAILSMLSPSLAALLNGLSATIDAMVTASIAAVLYIELRRLKDGTSAGDLASAFDA